MKQVDEWSSHRYVDNVDTTYTGFEGFARSTRVVHMTRSIALSCSVACGWPGIQELIRISFIDAETLHNKMLPAGPAADRGKPLRSSAFWRISSLSDRDDGSLASNCFRCNSGADDGFDYDKGGGGGFKMMGYRDGSQKRVNTVVSPWNLLMCEVRLDTLRKTAQQSSHRCTSPCSSLFGTCKRRTWARRLPETAICITPCHAVLLEVLIVTNGF